ncbi:O-antigen translocase [Myroides odoratimimus]|uniref:O-antigen translocase n=1 Tax=Myroides odoratimimus TaxID=76832 RepID=UPI0038D40A3D
MINNLVNKFKNNAFLVASMYSGFAAISKILSAVVIAKVVAVLLGPEGLALIGQLNNFILLSVTLAGTAISQGIVKYVAQYAKEDINRLNAIIGIGLRLVLYSCSLLALILILGSYYLSSYILLDGKFYFVFVLLGVTLVLSGLNSLFTSVLNGFKEFKKFNLITILSNLFGLIVTIILIYFYRIEGVLISLALNQTIIFSISYLYIRKEEWYSLKKYWRLPFNKELATDLSKYAVLSVFSTVLVPIVTILIRKIIIKEDSLTAAGYYEFVLRVSSVTIMFFSIIISTYYIPRISEINIVRDLKKEVRNTYNVVVPILIIILTVIYISRHLIIKVLATDEFAVVGSVLYWQLIGDFFKVLAQILSFILVAKALIKLAIVIEVIFNLTNLLLCFLLVPYYGFESVLGVYSILYFLYFISFVLIYKYVLLNVKKYNFFKM